MATQNADKDKITLEYTTEKFYCQNPIQTKP